MGLGLLGVAVSSSALSLGRARGNVVLGQPLSLAVEVRVDQPEDATAQCFRVDIFHGDTRLDSSRVRLVVQSPATGVQDAVLRIRSNAVVDEPVVGVVLHALCGQGGTRRYDFLPDFPAELKTTDPVNLAAAPLVPAAAATAAGLVDEPARSAAVVPSPAPAPAAAPAPRPAAKAPPPRSAATPAVRAPAAARAPTPAPRPAKAQRPAAPKVAAATAGGVAAAEAGAPRLTLDAAQGRNDGLQPSEALVSGPIDDAAQREAVAAIWRALRTTPEEIVRDRQRLLALEAQQGQRPAQPNAAERELRERLERAERRLDEAENGRVDILLVYGLLALLALVAALAAYFWYRARQAALAAATWGVDAPQPAAAGSAQAGLADAPPLLRPAVAAKASPADAFLGSEPDSAVGAVRATGVDTDAVAAVVFAHDRPTPVDASRPVRPDEFFDVQQHADFFVSLGQYEQAVEVLKQHLDERQDMSPLAFLELFGIYHQLGRKDDFAALRARFQQRFNARIPSFAAFTDEGLGLEDYPATLLAIETAWGHVRVLDTIEANLSRHPQDTGQPLDLAAYRDLLMLYGVAQDVFVPAGSTRPASGLAPFAVSAPVPTPAVPQLARGTDMGPGTGAALGGAALADLTLDLDLDLDTDVSKLARTPPRDDAPGLDLDIDLSTTPMPVAEPPVLSLVEVDIDLPLLDDAFDAAPAAPAPAPVRPAAKPPLDSGLIDFDLFDPNTEARIAPKSTR